MCFPYASFVTRHICRTSISTQTSTRHRASTSMYSLTFRVRVTTPQQYGENRAAHAAGASILSPARGVSLRRHAWCVALRAACGGPSGLPLGSATHFHSVAIATQPVHRLQIRPIVRNYRGHPIPLRQVTSGSVQYCRHAAEYRQTHRLRHTDTQTRVTTIHFSWSTTHAKCNEAILQVTLRRRFCPW